MVLFMPQSMQLVGVKSEISPNDNDEGSTGVAITVLSGLSTGPAEFCDQKLWCK